MSRKPTVARGLSPRPAAAAAPASASRLVRVRTIRPHETEGGSRAPGDEYVRPRSEAEGLASTVEIIGSVD